MGAEPLVKEAPDRRSSRRHVLTLVHVGLQFGEAAERVSLCTPDSLVALAALACCRVWRKFYRQGPRSLGALSYVASHVCSFASVDDRCD